MPELPEVERLAREMDWALPGRRVAEVEVRQPKCLNVEPAEFVGLLEGGTLGHSTRKGKWILTEVDPGGWLLSNLGMGGDLFLHDAGAELPPKFQVGLRFDDGAWLTYRFWWFGYVHAARREDLARHEMTAKLGPDPLDAEAFSLEAFRAMLAGRRGAIKPFLLDQANVAGIGNVYAQDPFWLAGLHPMRPIPSLSDDDVARLHAAIVEHLRWAVELGGWEGEKGLRGEGGRMGSLKVGYHPGEPCPRCQNPIAKVKTGATASYICEKCQV